MAADALMVDLEGHVVVGRVRKERGQICVVLQIKVPFQVPKIVFHPYTRDPKRDLI